MDVNKLRPIWSPEDFDACVEQALALVRDDTATVYDFAAKVVVR